MFMPQEASLRTIYSYYININPEGDVNLGDELNLQGLGTTLEISFVSYVLPISRLSYNMAMSKVFEAGIPVFNTPFFSWCWSGLGNTAKDRHGFPFLHQRGLKAGEKK
jgi:hypothetical protein